LLLFSDSSGSIGSSELDYLILKKAIIAVILKACNEIGSKINAKIETKISLIPPQFPSTSRIFIDVLDVS